MAKIQMTWEQVQIRIELFKQQFPYKPNVYGIPRGGSIVAGIIGNAVDTPEEADVIVDDILDSGKTIKEWQKKYSHKMFWVLVDKRVEDLMGSWIEFPWEKVGFKKDGETIITRMLEMIGEDATRDGLIGTPSRVVKSWNEIFAGYNMNPKDHIKTFEKGKYDQMIVLKNCELYSTCEHHLQPFVGRIHIAYLPDKNVIGISKLARIAECFSRRLQIQERICEQVTDFLMEELKPLGAACIISAKHFCMCARGVGKQNSEMITSSLKGVLREKEARQEFLSLINL